MKENLARSPPSGLLNFVTPHQLQGEPGCPELDKAERLREVYISA